MHECPKCGNWFRDTYILKNHLNRKKPCDGIKVENPDDTANSAPSNSAFGTSNSAFGTSNSALAPSNSAFGTSNSAFGTSNSALQNQNKCVYCLHTFYNKWNTKQHEKICKHRNETRNLEIEMGIDVTIPENKTECRFCKKAMFRTDALSKHVHVCKDRLDYHEQLLKQKDKKPETNIQTQNIQTQNNIQNQNIQNQINNTINIFGSPRSLEHIEVERIIQFLRDLKKQHITDQTYEQAGELVIMMEKYIQENEANRNFVIPDYRSAIGYIKQENDWEIVNVEKPLNIQFKETAGILCDKKEEIDNTNKKVFQNNTNCEIFKHVNYFNNKGFDHVMYGDQKLKVIKSNYKLTKLKNKSVVDF